MHNAVAVSEAVSDARAYLASLGIVGADSFTVTVGRGTMPRYAARRDTTHAEVRDILREAGATVFDAGGVGGDLPDLIVGWQGITFLIEVKSPGGKLSKGQQEFARNWRGGPVLTVYGAEAALAAMIKYRDAGKPRT